MNFAITLILAATLTLISCSSTKQSSGTAETKEKPSSSKQFNGDTDNGKTVELTVGETFDVTFYKECVGCAEVWQVTNRNADLIGLNGDKNISENKKPNFTGGNSTHVFQFKALKPGTSELAFSYFEQRFKLTVNTK